MRLQFLLKARKRIMLALVATLLMTGFALAPNTVASACGTVGGSCACPGC